MSQLFALVPAAGNGARMGGDLPKQYLPLGGRPLIYHALQVLSAHPRIAGVFVVLAADDAEWGRHDWSALRDLRVLRCGGATRALSVINGLRAMTGFVSPQDWILVHDAARCCLSEAHLDRLIEAVESDEVGGILAIPVADTLKRADISERISATVARSQLWQAQTPQMFRYGVLREALEQAGSGEAITDEASAVEAMGMHPRLVAADATNLKVTYPVDLELAEWILKQRAERRP